MYTTHRLFKKLVVAILNVSVATALLVTMQNSAANAAEIRNFEDNHPISRADKRRIEVLLQARDLITRHNWAWPSYDPFAIPALIYKKDDLAILINHPNPPEGFVLYDEPYFKAQGVSVHIRHGVMENFPEQPYDTSIDFNGKETYRVAATPEVHSPGIFAQFVLHERFHFEQKKWGENSYPEHFYPSEDADNLAFALLEHALLVDALSATDSNTRVESAKDFLAVRTLRRGRLTPDVVQFEDWKERFEGTARYVDSNARDALLKQDSTLKEDFRTYPAFGNSLEAALLSPITIDGVAQLRYYDTGAAQGRILDALLGSSWKPIVVQGKAITSILSELLPINAEEMDARTQDAQARHNFPKLLRKARQTIEDYQRPREEALLEFKKGLVDGVSVSVTSVANDMALIELRTEGPFYTIDRTRQLHVGTFVYHARSNESEFRLEKHTRGMMFDSSSFLTFFKSAPVIAVNGSQLELKDGRYPFARLEAGETGLKLLLSGQGSLTIQGRSLQIDFGKAN